ncbi:MAG TPA: hypothetical protein VGL63_17360 [Streptosporangiaceae bacterium]
MTEAMIPASGGTQAVPTIDPRSLTDAQLAGRRCAVPNCQRPLSGPVYKVGRLPGGRPVVACEECAGWVTYERAARLGAQAA